MTIRLLASIACLMIACATAARENPATSDGPASDGPEDPPPDSNNCAVQPCTILPQCGCPADDACDIDDDNDGGACRNVSATAQQEGGACSTISGCVAGTVCLGAGICRKYCDDNTDCGQPRGQCLITITDGTNPIPNVPKTCSSNCDPTNVAAGGCPANKKCSLFTINANNVVNNIVDCDVAGAGLQGADCKVGADGDDALCGKDHTCVTSDGGTTFTCRRMCVVGTACTVGTCTAFGTPFIVGGINYGVCP
jgi:hypothetical protein